MAVNILGQTLTGNTPPADAPKSAVGRIVYDSTSITTTDYTVLPVGFTPKYIRFENITDRTLIEWYEGMAANTCVKTIAAGTRSIETTNGGFTVCDSDSTANTKGRYVAVIQNATLAAILASKTCTWMALG